MFLGVIRENARPLPEIDAPRCHQRPDIWMFHRGKQLRAAGRGKYPNVQEKVVALITRYRRAQLHSLGRFPIVPPGNQQRPPYTGRLFWRVDSICAVITPIREIARKSELTGARTRGWGYSGNFQTPWAMAIIRRNGKFGSLETSSSTVSPAVESFRIGRL